MVLPIQNVEPGAGADMEANDTQGQLALGVWYTMEQDDERAGKWWSGDVLLRNGCWNVGLGRYAGAAGSIVLLRTRRRAGRRARGQVVERGPVAEVGLLGRGA